MLVIKTDMTYTVTHQTTQILSPGGPQNALKSHTKPPHGKPLVGQACSIDVGEPRTSPEGSHAEWRHFSSVGLRRSAAANRAASESDRPR